jgi:hypothetical protein
MSLDTTRVSHDGVTKYQESYHESMARWMNGVINKPSTDSFVPFFREWFRTEWFPEMAEEMHQRMDQRFREQSRQSVLGILQTAAATMLMQGTKSMQCDLACSAILARSGVTFRDLQFGTWAEMTIERERTSSRGRNGARTMPTKVHFVGFNGEWYALPKWMNRGLALDLGGLASDVARDMKREIDSAKQALEPERSKKPSGTRSRTKRRPKRSGGTRKANEA